MQERWYQIWHIAKANGLFLDARGMPSRIAYDDEYNTQCNFVESTMLPANANPEVWDDWCRWHAEHKLWNTHFRQVGQFPFEEPVHPSNLPNASRLPRPLAPIPEGHEMPSRRLPLSVSVNEPQRTRPLQPSNAGRPANRAPLPSSASMNEPQRTRPLPPSNTSRSVNRAPLPSNASVNEPQPTRPSALRRRANQAPLPSNAPGNGPRRMRRRRRANRAPLPSNVPVSEPQRTRPLPPPYAGGPANQDRLVMQPPAQNQQPTQYQTPPTAANNALDATQLQATLQIADLIRTPDTRNMLQQPPPTQPQAPTFQLQAPPSQSQAPALQSQLQQPQPTQQRPQYNIWDFASDNSRSGILLFEQWNATSDSSKREIFFQAWVALQKQARMPSTPVGIGGSTAPLRSSTNRFASMTNEAPAPSKPAKQLEEAKATAAATSTAAAKQDKEEGGGVRGVEGGGSRKGVAGGEGDGEGDGEGGEKGGEQEN